MAKKKSGGGGANWMDTYGDMVTLLLCFFVLLYSMSTISEDKWRALVQSFNPAGIPTNMEEIMGGDGPSADDNNQGGVFDNPDAIAQEDIDAVIADLAAAIEEMVAEEGLASSIKVDLNGGKVYITFSDTLFFLGDSYALQPQARDVLSKLCTILDTAKDAIDEIRVQGHTAQAQANVRNPVDGDRRLASLRATEVVIFLQENSSIHPARLISEGCGQWRPISSNATADTRAFNRRVEMVISGVDLDEEKMNELMAQYITRSDEDGGLHSVNGTD